MGAIIRVASCNFIEAYDFVVYGYFAAYIARAFFPAASVFASLMLALATFGAGYLMRPLGAIVLGAYMDRKGRRGGLLLTLGLMAAGTLSIAVTPSYAEIGLAAPLIIIAGRLVQGFSAGAEFGGVAVYLSEIATPGHRGFYCAWQGVSQQVAVVAAALFGFGLTALVSPGQMDAWGWRVPLLAGLIAIPLILWLRNSLEETESFQQARHPRSTREVIGMLVANWKPLVHGIALAAMTTTSFYLITAYTPTYARAALHMPANTVYLATLLAGISNVVWLPVGGALSDRFGARPLMAVATAAAILTAYPAMLWLVSAPDLARLLAVLLLYSLFFGLYYGAMTPLIAAMMPEQIRTAGFSLAFVTATTVFGGFTPAICTWLIEASGNRAAPALWLSLSAGLSLMAVWRPPFVSRRPEVLRAVPVQ